MPPLTFDLAELMPATFPLYILPAPAVPVFFHGEQICVADVPPDGHVRCDVPAGLEDLALGMVNIYPRATPVRREGLYALHIDSIDILDLSGAGRPFETPLSPDDAN